MEKFPDEINSSNQNSFLNIKVSDIENNFRKDIFMFLIYRKSNEEYMDLDKYVNDLKSYPQILKTVLDELSLLNWKTQLAYGNTGLFIYDDEIPLTCRITLGQEF